MRKGKLKFYMKIEHCKDYRKLFAKFGERSEIPDMMDRVEKFLCDIYNKPRLSSLGDCRYALFWEKYAPKNQFAPLEKMKRADDSTLPPSRSVIVHKMKRTN